MKNVTIRKSFIVVLVIFALIGVLFLAGCNGANDKEEATDNDELYRVNIEDPISNCRVERGNKIYSLSGYVSAEKAEEFGVTGFSTKYIPYEEQFRDDSHIQFEGIFMYDYYSSNGEIVIANDWDPLTISRDEKIICSSDGLKFYSLVSGGYATLDDGSTARLYAEDPSLAEKIDVASENNGSYWEYDVSSLRPGQYEILFDDSQCPRYWWTVITIE